MRLRPATVLVGILIGAPGIASAGPYADDLSRCLVSSTTEEDRTSLVKWMFAAMGSHPAVKSMSLVTPEQLDQANETVAHLIFNLLTKSCVDQARKAVQYEGPGTIRQSFQLLGQVASSEIFKDPSVANALKGLGKYVDDKQLTAALQSK